MKISLIDQDGERIKGGDELWPWIVRGVSIPIARFCQVLHVRPEAIIALSFASGLLSGVTCASGRFTQGALLCLLAWILDFVDGDLARKSKHVSKRGALFDSINGKFLFFFVYGGATIGLWREVGGAWPWVLVFLFMSAVYLFSTIKAKADQLDEEIAKSAPGFHHQGTYLDKSFMRLAGGFLLSGNDFLLVYFIVAGLLGRVDLLLYGSVIYAWAYVCFTIYHAVKRIGYGS